MPIAQNPSPYAWAPLIVRSSGAPTGVTGAIAQRIGRLHPGIAIQIVELKTQVRERLIGERMIAWLAGTFGILAVAWRAARIRLDEALRCEQRQRFSLEIDPGRSRY